MKNVIASFVKNNGIIHLVYNLSNSNEKKDYNRNFYFIRNIISELKVDLSIIFTDRNSVIVNDEINLLNLSNNNSNTYRGGTDNVQLDYELLLLSKLLEFYLIEKYNKNINDIKNTLTMVNISDFIIQNLFLNEEIYDIINFSYKNFKEKFFWNFSEIIYFIYIKHPRLLKYTILRHLKYSPSQESLLNQLVQYYYENKDYKKTKLLIRVK